MSTFLGRVIWFVTGGFVLVCLAGLITGFGGGDARFFYCFLLLADAVLVYAALLWARYGVGETYWDRISYGTLAAVLAALMLMIPLQIRVHPEHAGVLVKDGVVRATLEPGFHLKGPFVTFKEQLTRLSGKEISLSCQTTDGFTRPVVVKYGAAIDLKRMAEFYARNPNGLDLDGRVHDALTAAIRSLVAESKDAELDAKRCDVEKATRKQVDSLLERDHIAVTEFDLAFFSRVP